MSFDTLANKLVAFETFDRAAFIEDSEWPQEVCDFVLSLGLAYNDFRDVFFSRKLLDEIPINLKAQPTVVLALRNGIENTIVRIQCGFIHELLNLCSQHRETINNQSFQKIIRKMSKSGKQAWQIISDASTSKRSEHPLAQALVLIRNKASFHYDPKQLGGGYRMAFINSNNCGDPLISQGSALSNTRFYFADAASQSYILSKAKTDQENEFLLGQGEFIESINLALYEIVTRFIQARSAWRKPKSIGSSSA